MGNQVTSLSPTESIRDLLDGNITLRKCSCAEVATHLSIVVILATHVASGDIVVTKQQSKDLVQVSDVIVKMLDEINTGNIVDPDALYLQEKALHALIRLLVIPQYAKKTFEHSVHAIMKCTNTSSVNVFTLAFVAFFNGFRSIEEESSVMSGLRQGMTEEASRNSVCLQLDKMGIYPRLMHFLTQTSAREDDNMILTSILIFRFLSWTLTRTSHATNALRFKLRMILLHHQDSLFELTRHKSSSLSDMAVNMIVLLLRLEEPSTCVTLQDSARKYGALLWTLYRLVWVLAAEIRSRDVHGRAAVANLTNGGNKIASNTTATSTHTVRHTASVATSTTSGDFYEGRASGDFAQLSPTAESEEIESTDEDHPGGQIKEQNGLSTESDLDDRRPKAESSQMVNGLLDKRFLPPKKKASRIERIQRSQLCVSLLCLGNTANSAVVLSAFPVAMREALTPHSSFMMMNLLRYISAPKDTLMSSTFGDKMGGDTAAWFMLFGLLEQTIENPLLIWNSQMLSHLEDVLKGQCDNLDYMRQLRHDSWDARYLDVDYSPVYERQRYVVVQGVFLHRIIDVLELGKSEYITDPISFAWGLIDFVLTSKPSSCETESSVDEENSLLALRTLHLLMLRYHQEIGSKIPVRSLCEILRMGVAEYSTNTTERTSIANSPFRPTARPAARTVSGSGLYSTCGGPAKLSGACSPKWLHRVVNLLRLRRHNSSRAEMIDYAACGGIDTLLRILSTYAIVHDMSLFVAADYDDAEDKSSVASSAQNDNADPPSTPTRRTNLPVADVPIHTPVDSKGGPLLKRLSLARKNPAAVAHQAAVALSASDIERKHAYALQQKMKETSQLEVINDIGQYVVTALDRGSAVLADTSLLLFALVHESTVCAQHIASQPQLMERLVRSMWLLSSHGPYRPGNVSAAVQNVLHTLMRVMHSLPEVVYSSLLLSTPILPVVLATGITPNGEGEMTASAVELLADIMVSVRSEVAIPNLPSASVFSESDMSLLSSDEGVIGTDSPGSKPGKRLSLRQVVIAEGPTELSVDPFGVSIENEDATRVLMSRSQRSIGSKQAPLPAVFDVVSRVLPLQLARLCVDLVPSLLCSNVFNVDVQAPNAVWNCTLRRDLVIGIYLDLDKWHQDAFKVPIPAPSCADKMMIDEDRFTRYTSLHQEPQLSGVLLRFLIRMQSAKDIIGPFDVRLFANDLIHAVQGSLSEFRRKRVENAIVPRRKSGDNFAPSVSGGGSVQCGPNEALMTIVPEKRIELLFLGLGKVIEFFAFPEDLWFTDVLPVVCHVIESFCGIVDNALVSSPASLQKEITCELSVKVFATCAIVVVQSLTAAGFVQDDSVKQTQATSFTQSLRQFRVDEMGVNGPLALFKECQRALIRVLRLCSISSDDGKFHLSAEFSRSLDVLLSSVCVFFAQLSSQIMELTPVPIEDTRTHGSNVGMKSADEQMCSSLVQVAPVEALTCLRVLKEEGVYLDLIRCVRYSVIATSPTASLCAMTSLRLLLAQARENSPALIETLLQSGLPVFLLHSLMLLLADDLEPFTSFDKPWISHPALPVTDKFTEKAQAPLNRRRSVAGVSDEEHRKTVEAAMGAVPRREDSDSNIPPSLGERSLEIMARNQATMVQLMSTTLGPGVESSPQCVDRGNCGDVSEQDGLLTAGLKRQLVYECVLLIRSLVFTANDFELKSDGSLPARNSFSATMEVSLSTSVPQGPSTVPVTGAPQTKPPALVEFLEQILTPSLLHVLLFNFSVFVEIFRATKPTKRPLVIWNAQMKSLLKSYLINEIEKMRSNEQSSDSPVIFDVQSCMDKEGFKSFYHFLAEEVVVDGVYVKLLLDPQHRDDIGARDMPSFVELLQASVSSSQRVLELVNKSRRQSMAGKSSLVSQVSVKQQVLDHIIRQHPELGYADLYVMDDQTY